MTREILFRGKREDNGEWVYGNHLFDDVSGKHFIIPFGNINESQKVGEDGLCYCVGFEVIPETVGQYTGLQNCKGKKIFESDIIEGEYYVNYGQVGEFKPYRDVVKWNIEKSVCEPFYKYEDCFFMITSCNVIGNIHDNPELLEEK